VESRRTVRFLILILIILILTLILILILFVILPSQSREEIKAGFVHGSIPHPHFRCSPAFGLAGSLVG